MARARRRSRLNVWMNGLDVGTWEQAPGGEHLFAYRDTWLEQPEARPLSLSMPLQSGAPYRGAIVEDWFENLLPDNREIRQRIQGRFGTSSTRAFDLLSEVGRDCIGAVQLVPEGEVPEAIEAIRGDPLDDHAVACILRATPTAGAMGRDDDVFRISLAGAQEKTALLWHDGRWHAPHGTTPTTHILKLPLGRVGNFRGDLSSSVENEWLCSRIVAAFGLPVADTAIGVFEDQKALIVERFDRRLAPGGTHWLRLPQEDMCQALGVPSALKYESDGGPGVRSIMDLLLGSRTPDTDRWMFFRAQVVFWMLCAIDGHAKNFSIAIGSGGRFALTPLYDVLSAWPVVGRGANQLARERARMAMAVLSRNRHDRWTEIQPRHWASTARACGLDPDEANRVVLQTATLAPAAIERAQAALPPWFPGDVSGPILDGVGDAAERLVRGLAR